MSTELLAVRPDRSLTDGEAALLLAVAAALLWGFAAGRGAASCRLPELEFPYGGYNGRVG